MTTYVVYIDIETELKDEIEGILDDTGLNYEIVDVFE